MLSILFCRPFRACYLISFTRGFTPAYILSALRACCSAKSIFVQSCSAEDRVFHGKIEGIDGLVTFEGTTAGGLIKAFHEEVDDYVELCKAQNKEPLRSYKGSFNVRISPELHREAVVTAKTIGITLNGFVQRVIEKELVHKE